MPAGRCPQLPKAHLHLHFTGAMRHATLVELARTHGVRLPPALTEDWPPRLSGADERGWFRFQRLYDTARSVLRTPADVRRLLTETAEDERAEGSRWLEIQVDPSGYAARFGGITAVTELVLDAAAAAAHATGVGIGVIIAANRTKHPLEARTLARLAAQYAGRGVTGFGLSNDERRGPAHDFAAAFRIAERAGLLLVPHGGELAGPASVAACLDDLHADRIGHGIRAAEDPALVKRLAAERHHLRGVPVFQRRARRRAGPGAGPAAPPVRGRRAGRARRRRPAAFRPAADRAVRDRAVRALVHRRRTGRPGPRVGARLGGTRAAASRAADRDRRLARHALPIPGPIPRLIPGGAEYYRQRISFTRHGDDPAITGEPPEERASAAWPD